MWQGRRGESSAVPESVHLAARGAIQANRRSGEVRGEPKSSKQHSRAGACWFDCCVHKRTRKEPVEHYRRNENGADVQNEPGRRPQQIEAPGPVLAHGLLLRLPDWSNKFACAHATANQDCRRRHAGRPARGIRGNDGNRATNHRYLHATIEPPLRFPCIE